MAGRSCEQLKDNAKAAEFYEKVVQRPTPDDYTEKALYRLGFLYEGDKARASVERYRKLFPQGKALAELQLKLAEARFGQNDFEGAATQYAALLQGGLPANLQPTANYGLGWCRLKQEKLDEADACFEKAAAVADSPVAADALLQRGEIAYRREKFEVAKGSFEKLAAQPPPRGERALYMAAWCCRRGNDAPGATQRFREFLAKYPKSEFAPDASVRLAEALLAAKQFADAKTVLATALAAAPGKEHEENLSHLYGDALVGLQEWKDLLDASRALAAKFPESKRAYQATFRQGLACQALGALDDAEKQFRDTVAKTDTIEAAQAQFNLGSLSYTRQQYVEAAKNFLRVEMLYDYGDLAPKALYHAVDSFRRAADPQRAEFYVQKLKDKYPNSPWTKKAQEK